MKKLLLLASMIVGFTGLRILLLSSYQSKMLGVLLAFLGLYYLRRLSNLKGLEKRNTLLFPLVGFVVIAGVLAFNLLSTGVLDLKGFDQMALLFGLALIAYNWIPAKYETETRFLGVFFGVFFLIQVGPLLLHSMLNLLLESKLDMEASAVWYVNNFLGRPMEAALRLLGIESVMDGNILTFSSVEGFTSVKITLACSGAYSFSIFTSAFAAYVLVKYRILCRKTLLLLITGVFMTYLANLFRMLTVILAGYFYGGRMMVLVHEHLGWLLFMLWTLLFWTVMFKTLGGEYLKNE